MTSRIPVRGALTRAALWIGAAGAVAFAWLPVAPSWQVRLLFAPLCHQQAERTLMLFGETMAVCSRCSGLYFGAAAATVLTALAVRSLWWPRPVWFLLAIAPTAVDAMLPWAGLPQLALVPRHFLAWPAGFAAGWFFSLGVAAMTVRPGHFTLASSVEVGDG